MKRLVLILSVLFALSLASVGASAEVVFTAYPDQAIGSASIGYRFGSLEAFGSMDVAGFSVGLKSDDDEASLGGNIVMWGAGAKWVLPVASEVQPYVKGALGYIKPWVSVKNTSNPDSADHLEQEINDVLDKSDFYGVLGAIGAEYPLGNGFSVAGEYGIRALLTNTDLTGDSSQNEAYAAVERSLRTRWNATYSSVGLVYRF